MFGCYEANFHFYMHVVAKFSEPLSPPQDPNKSVPYDRPLRFRCELERGGSETKQAHKPNPPAGVGAGSPQRRRGRDSSPPALGRAGSPLLRPLPPHPSWNRHRPRSFPIERAERRNQAMSVREAGQAAERDERGRDDDYEQQQARVLMALMQSFCAARYRKADNTPCPIEQVWSLASSLALCSVIRLSTRSCRGLLGTDDPGARRWDILY
jgi:hypothetical protein